MDTLWDAIEENEEQFEQFEQLVYDAVKYSLDQLGHDKIPQLIYDWSHNSIGGVDNDE